jgi:hypothetical protein
MKNLLGILVLCHIHYFQLQIEMSKLHDLMSGC